MPGIINGRVVQGAGIPVAFARVNLHSESPCKDENLVHSVLTDEDGRYEFRNIDAKQFHIRAKAFGLTSGAKPAEIRDEQKACQDLPLDLGLSIAIKAFTGNCEEVKPCERVVAGRPFVAVGCADSKPKQEIEDYEFTAFPDGAILQSAKHPDEAEITFAESGAKRLDMRVRDKHVDEATGKRATTRFFTKIVASQAEQYAIGGRLGVRLERTGVHPTLDQALWIAIRNRTHAISFNRYHEFMNRVLQAEELENKMLDKKLKDLGAHLHGVGAYNVMKVATEAFLLLECGVRIEDDRGNRLAYDSGFEAARCGQPVSFEFAKTKLSEYLGSPPQLPYITRVIEAAFPEWRAGSVRCDRVLTGQINEPCLIELIWSYWHEEGMLAQTMNAVTRRFQNVRGAGERDPIAHLEIDPLRPMNNILWGFVQDEIHRLSVKRRAYEYEHQYGLTLYGKAVREMRPADSRSKFLEAFHNLMHLCSVFFKEDNDTTVIADGYPLLNALKEVHLLLAQGAHNQFGDLPWTARTEMMLQQWMLARPEIRDFLQSRAMVPYKEPWMPQVDTMKTLQGWTDVTVTHFRDLAVYGEQILLSVRYGDWIAIVDEDSAKNWARYWRPEIQGYLHAYRAATGIDLTNPDTVDSTVPAVLLQKRLVLQQQRTR
jgi:Carboxypeptidase regulatory-like domain